MGRGWMALGLAGLLAGANFMIADERPHSDYDDAIPVGHREYVLVLAVTSAKGMYPGRSRPMTLTAINPHGFMIKIVDINTEVVATSRRRCRPSASNLVIKSYRGKLPQKLTSHQHMQLSSLTVYMPMNASVECAKTTFVVRVKARAARAGR